MGSLLIDDAVEHVWCNPRQDNLIIMAPKRISGPAGATVSMLLMGRMLPMPTSTARYHVYLLGRMLPKRLGLVGDQPIWGKGRWRSLPEAMNESALFCDLYTDGGLQVPRFAAHYLYTEDNALVIAVEDLGLPQIQLTTQPLYFRFYSNAYFDGLLPADLAECVHTRGQRITHLSHIVALQNEVAARRARTGFVYCYVNGLLVKSIDVGTTKVGDVAEYVYDASVKREVCFTVRELEVFTSTMDAKLKYLLHPPKDGGDTIDFHDDVDLYVTTPETVQGYQGVYYHRNQVASVRMVTHRDYSVLVESFVALATALKTRLGQPNLDPRDLQFRLRIREAGYHRPLVLEHQRLFELYKLPDAEIVQAMVGVKATVSVWDVAALEASAYVALMQVPEREAFQQSLVEAAYGYNGTAVFYAATPVKATLSSNSPPASSLPVGLAQSSTLYDYDANGKLLGVSQHNFGAVHRSVYSAARLFEGFVGRGTYRPKVLFGTDQIPLPVANDYRVYMCYLVGGVPNNVWTDITGSSKYEVVNGKLVWSNEEYDQFLMVRSDETFLDYELTVPPVAGTFYFTLSEEEDRGDGIKEYALPVPGKNLDLFLGPHSLIHGIDYVVDFPKVHVFNKRFLEQPANTTPQRFRIRSTGFCDTSLTYQMPTDTGFVEYGVLSNNGKYDIRDDKILRIVVGGKTMHRDDLVFSEHHQGVAVTDALNGTPYQIQEMAIPLQPLLEQPVGPYQAAAQAVDAEIVGYLTQQLPQPPRDGVSAIPTRYPLVSPFVTHLIHDLADGKIDRESVDRVLSDAEVLVLCEPYLPLLKNDPLNPDLGLGDKNIVIHPLASTTPVRLNLYAYRFLRQAVKLYSQGRVDLSTFITVS